MEQHAVPQQFMDIEFKLFGELTIKQFAFVAGGGILALIFYFSGLPGILRIPLVAVCGLGGLVLALVKINDRPSSEWLVNFILALFGTQRRIWKKSPETPEILKTRDFKSGSAPTSTSQQVTRYTQDPGVMSQPRQISVPKPPAQAQGKLDVEERKRMQSLKFNSSQAKAPAKQAMNTFQRQVPSTTINQNKPQPKLAGSINPLQDKVHSVNISNSRSQVFSAVQNQQANRPLTTPAPVRAQAVPTPGIKQPQQNVQAKPIPSKKPTVSTQGGQQSISPTGVSQKVKVAASTSLPKKQVAPSAQVVAKPQNQKAQQATPKVTPLQKQQTVNKAQAFGDVIPKQQPVDIKSQTQPLSPQPPQAVQPPPSGLREKVATYSDEVSKLRDELKRSREHMEKLKKEKESAMFEKADLSRKVEDIEKRLNELAGEKKVSKAVEVQSKPAQPSPQFVNPNIPMLTKTPNVISGIVKDKSGKLLNGVIVVVKNEKGKPVRALKSNPLGQFVTTTPLENGTYKVELAKEGEMFEGVELELNGQIQPTLEFRSR